MTTRLQEISFLTNSMQVNEDTTQEELLKDVNLRLNTILILFEFGIHCPISPHCSITFDIGL